MSNLSLTQAYRTIVNALLAIGEGGTVNVIKSNELPKGPARLHITTETRTDTPSVVIYPAKYKTYDAASDAERWLHIYSTEAIWDELFDDTFTDSFCMPKVKDGRVTFDCVDIFGDIDTITLELNIDI